MALAPAVIPALPARPSVSIIMAVRNEAEYIVSAVESVATQTYPHELLRIVLADALSTDGTVAAAIGAAGDVPIAVLPNTNGSYPAGLNVALSAAPGAILVKLDGHAELDPDYVEIAIEELRRTDAAVAGSRIRTRGRGLTGRGIAYALSDRLVVGGAEFRYAGRSRFVTSVPFGAYRREVFEAVGLFREDIGRAEDLELHDRIRSQGGRILLIEQALATYWCRDTFIGLWRQYFASGRDMARHSRWIRLYQVVPGFAALVGAVSLCAALARWLPFMAPALFILIYLLLIALVALRAASHGAPPGRTAVAVIVAHAGQASGFWYGLFIR